MTRVHLPRLTASVTLNLSLRRRAVTPLSPPSLGPATYALDKRSSMPLLIPAMQHQNSSSNHQLSATNEPADERASRARAPEAF